LQLAPEGGKEFALQGFAPQVEALLKGFEPQVETLLEGIEVAFHGDVGPADRREMFHQGRGRLGAEYLFEAEVELVSGPLIENHGRSLGTGWSDVGSDALGSRGAGPSVRCRSLSVRSSSQVGWS
jgi:hypothetical protein